MLGEQNRHMEFPAGSVPITMAIALRRHAVLRLLVELMAFSWLDLHRPQLSHLVDRAVEIIEEEICIQTRLPAGLGREVVSFLIDLPKPADYGRSKS